MLCMSMTNKRFCYSLLSTNHETYANLLDNSKADYLKNIIIKYLFNGFTQCIENIENYDIQGKNGNINHDLDLVINDILTNKVKTIVGVLFEQLQY